MTDDYAADFKILYDKQHKYIGIRTKDVELAGMQRNDKVRI